MARRMCQRTVLAAISLLAISTAGVSAAPALFQALPGAANARLAITAPRGPADSGCWSVMRLNAAALQSGEMLLQTPCLNATLQGGLQPGANQRAALVDYGADAGTSWVGTVADDPFSIVAVTTSPSGVVSGSIMMKGETHAIEYREGSTYSVYKVDDGRLPRDHPKPVIPPGAAQVYQKPQHQDAASRAATRAPAPAPTAAKAAAVHLNRAPTAATGRRLMGRQLLESPGQVDVGIFWTANAQNSVGGAPQMQAKIRAAVVATNAVYVASKLKLRLRLVYMGYQGGYTADTVGHDMGATLASFANNGDGPMDEAHRIRARYGLDAMVLISNDASYCGLAYVMNNPATFNWPFSVVAPNCLPLTLAHELGHNFGMQHDHDQYTAGTPYKPSSFGYRVPGQFATIMAYPCSAYANCPNCAPCPRIPYFSNPYVKAGQKVVGVKNYADASATLNDLAVLRMMANWGKRKTVGRPSTPGAIRVRVLYALQAASKGYTRVDWAADPKNFADGVLIYRKTGVAKLGVNSMVKDVRSGSVRYWVDTKKFARRTKVCYQVVAYNFNARSTASKEVCITK